MTEWHRAIASALAGVAAVGVALAGAGLAVADPAEPPLPPGTTPVPPPPADAGPPPAPANASAMTPNQPAVPLGDPAAPPAPVFRQEIPEIANPTYGSGNGLLGTLTDLWHQARDPYYAPDQMSAAGSVAPPPGAGPAPPLPPGYVSVNAPGSETPVTAPDGGGPATGRPALPPGYYSLSGPPPPGYEFSTSQGPGPAAPTP